MVLKGAFAPLGMFLLAATISIAFLPLTILIGFPWLVGIGIWYAGLWWAGRVERPGEMAAVWVTYLSFILVLYGILIGFDASALAGATQAEKRFGRKVAYVGAAIAGAAVVTAYALDVRRRVMGEKPDPGFPLDDLARG